MTKPMGLWGIRLKRISWTSTDKRALVGRNAKTEGFWWINLDLVHPSEDTIPKQNLCILTKRHSQPRRMLPNENCCMLLHFLGGVAQTLSEGFHGHLRLEELRTREVELDKSLRSEQTRKNDLEDEADNGMQLRVSQKVRIAKTIPWSHGSWMFRVVFPMTQERGYFFLSVFWSVTPLQADHKI